MASFAERASAIATQTLFGLGLSLAQETGILSALAESEIPMTSKDVAAAKSLKERYVRELLNALATAELVQVEEGETGTYLYTLKEEDKALLKSNSSPGPYMAFPGVLAMRYEAIKERMDVNGPSVLRYTDHTQDWLDDWAKVSLQANMAVYVEKVPGLKAKLELGIDAIEFGSGRARLTAAFAQQYPNSRFVASECSPKLVEEIKSRWPNIPNLSFSVDNLCKIPEVPEKKFDWVFMDDVVHDLPDPLSALQGIKRLLGKPDGILTFIDIATQGSPIADKGNMMAAMYYAAGTFMCIPESFQEESSAALGPCWGRPTALMLAKKAGFDITDVDLGDSGSLKSLYICEQP